MSYTMPLGALRSTQLPELIGQIAIHFGADTANALYAALDSNSTAIYSSESGQHRISRHPSGMWFHTLDATTRYQ